MTAADKLTFANPPSFDDPSVPTRDEIAAALTANAGQFAIVARHDRSARAATHAERIESGKEYGSGFEAVARQVGPEHRVYARKVR
jgi:hypothetical protein